MPGEYLLGFMTHSCLGSTPQRFVDYDLVDLGVGIFIKFYR